VLIRVLLDELLYCDVLIKYYFCLKKYYLCFIYLDLFEISFILFVSYMYALVEVVVRAVLPYFYIILYNSNVIFFLNEAKALPFD
jgi:hypothetical protein